MTEVGSNSESGLNLPACTVPAVDVLLVLRRHTSHCPARRTGTIYSAGPCTEAHLVAEAISRPLPVFRPFERQHFDGRDA